MTRWWLSLFGRQWDPSCCVSSTCTFFIFFSKWKSFPFISKSTGEGQLWAVLAVLAGKTDGKSSERSPFWELPYVQTIQFSVSSLKGVFNLQCRFEAWAEFLEQRRTFYNMYKFHKGFHQQLLDGWVMPAVLQMLVWGSFVLKKHGAKQNRISWANTWSLVLIILVPYLLFFRMVPLCALSPPWWRQCFHWLSSSVACWWKWPSLDWASLAGCRTPDVLFVRVDEVRRDSSKGGWNLGYSARRIHHFCMIFVRPKIETLELPSSFLPWEALTLLYIGGASSSSTLLSCQETDGANEARMAVQMGRASMWKSNRKIWVEMLRMRYQHKISRQVFRGCLFVWKIS